jgi:hypothetical protein
VTPGSEAMVVLPPHRKPTRARLYRVEPNGQLTFVHPRNGGLRTVEPERVTREIKPKAKP